MAEDLLKNLKNYQLQLQQVEAALTTDPESEDLQKLRVDLQEVIELTQDLVKSQTGVSLPVDVSTTADTSEATGSNLSEAAGSSSGSYGNKKQAPQHSWSVGEKCTAMWGDDAGYYPAIIEEILDDGSCTVTFDNYGNTEVTQVELLRVYDENRKRGADGQEEEDSSKKPKTKKDEAVAQREYKRKKSQKKAQKRAELETAKEEEKKSWLAFNAKVFSKTSKGKVKKSIFASPDTTQGKVGVGTCGKSGNPMTAYHQNEKWKKGMT